MKAKDEKDLIIFGIDFSKFSCNPGYEFVPGLPLCYPKCKPGYSPFAGFFCASTCMYEQARLPNGDPQWQDPPKNTIPILINTGDDWHDDGLVCRKNLYNRGVGTIPDACDQRDDKTKDSEFFAKMCYKRCDGGKVATLWSPSTCADPCPPNTNEGGFANCTKLNIYGRGAGNWGLGCPPGFDNMGFYCYRWWEPAGSGYRCPGNCPSYPRDSNFAYGRSSNCNIALINTPAYQVKRDAAGNEYTDSGCFLDPFNAGSFLPFKEPSYYYAGDGIPNSGPGRYPPWYNGPGLNQECRDINCAGLPMPAYDSSGNPVDRLFNTKFAPRINESCAENWGSLCYPKCDVGFKNAGCCLCSPNCGNLRDDGATCARGWYNRGVGIIPNYCTDENRIYQELLCYPACKDKFINFVTTCTRTGCPYDGVGETALVCSKQMYGRGGPQVALPGLGDLVNTKINIGPLVGSLQRIILNGVFILLCLIAALFIFSTNGLLRTKTTHVNTDFGKLSGF
jgi:hypothetical protein